MQTLLDPPAISTKKNTKSCRCINHQLLASSELRAMFPFDKAKEVWLNSYENDGSGEELPKGVVPKEKYKDSLQLNNKQIEQLAQILYNYGYSEKPSIINELSCFVPRHSVIFLDEKRVKFASIDICFECLKVQVSPETLFLPEMCAEKMKMLKKMFRSVGAKYHLY